MEAKKRIRLNVASPCTADWNSMKGDDAVRHCGSCKKSVYQISNMSTEQVEALLTSSGGQTCVRFYQRKDGTLLTEDCFVGLRRRRRKQAVVGASMGVLSALGVAIGSGNSSPPVAVNAPPQVIIATPVVEVVEPVLPVQNDPNPEIEEYRLIMGEVALEEFLEPELPSDDADTASGPVSGQN